MKTFTVFCLAIVALAIYQYRDKLFPPPPPPKPVETVAAPVHRLAPDGVYYLRAYVSIRTNRGVTGLTPGQRVTSAGGPPQADGSILVTDGTHSIAVSSQLLTRDLDEAGALRTADEAGQATAMSQVTAADADLAAQARSASIAAANEMNAISSRMAASNTIGASAGRLQEYGKAVGRGGYNSGTVYVPTGPAQATPRPQGTGSYRSVAAITPVPPPVVYHTGSGLSRPQASAAPGDGTFSTTTSPIAR